MPQPDYLPGLLARLEQADPDGQLALLERAAQEHPADARPLLLLAAEFAHRRQHDRAESVYALALLRAPGFSIARFQMGLLQFSGGRVAQALLTWAPLDSLPEGHYLRLFRDGLAALAGDAFADAERLLREGMAANQENLPLNADMQMVLERTREAGEPPSGDSGGSTHFLLGSYKSGT
jgi:hypothetical protein